MYTTCVARHTHTLEIGFIYEKIVNYEKIRKGEKNCIIGENREGIGEA
jgi:hypothetical protein